MRKVLLLPLATLLVSSLASGDTLLQIYQKAVRSDPLVREADANRLATQQGKPIARGALLPQVNATASYGNGTSNGSTTTQNGNLVTATPIDSRNYYVRNWNVQLRQSVFRWDQWVTLSQANKKSAQADVDYEAAQEDLVIRVSEAYFNVLAAEDTLASEQAAKEAIGRQLEQAQKRFEVGLIAITDVQEAQAAYDQAVAAEILAKRSLANQEELLRTIIDEPPPKLAKPVENLPLQSPDPADENRWVDLAMQQNRTLISSQIGTEVAKDNVSLARTGHYPTVDLVLGRNNQNNDGFSRTCKPIGSICTGPAPDGNITRGGTSTDLQADAVSLQFTLPVFSGGTTSAKVEQAVYQHRAARERLERTARETERATRDAYLGVMSDISRVQALKQAFESAKTALKATEAGFDVGTRTTVDVLAARRTLFNAETVYLRSRYDYLINGLRLKQAAGTLTTDDIVQIDGVLTTTATSTEAELPSREAPAPVAN
jgi:outer membrane protein